MEPTSPSCSKFQKTVVTHLFSQWNKLWFCRRFSLTRPSSQRCISSWTGRLRIRSLSHPRRAWSSTQGSVAWPCNPSLVLRLILDLPLKSSSLCATCVLTCRPSPLPSAQSCAHPAKSSVSQKTHSNLTVSTLSLQLVLRCHPIHWR